MWVEVSRMLHWKLPIYPIQYPASHYTAVSTADIHISIPLSCTLPEFIPPWFLFILLPACLSFYSFFSQFIHLSFLHTIYPFTWRIYFEFLLCSQYSYGHWKYNTVLMPGDLLHSRWRDQRCLCHHILVIIAGRSRKSTEMAAYDSELCPSITFCTGLLSFPQPGFKC